MNGPVSTRETGPRVALRSVVDVCTFVDRLADDAIGELRVLRHGAVSGAIFVERGRICWAAAHGMAARLTQMLMEPSGLHAAQMEDVFRQCKRDGIPLGEFLVARGILAVEDLQRALQKHTTESLHALCSDDTLGGWCPRPARRGYNPRFTFKTSELLASALAQIQPPNRAVLEGLARFADATPGEWAAAFVRVKTLATPVPIAVRGALPEKSKTVLRLGKWAASALDVAGILQDSDAFVSALEEDGASLVAWSSDGVIVAGRMIARGPARILNYRAEARRATSRTRG